MSVLKKIFKKEELKNTQTVEFTYNRQGLLVEIEVLPSKIQLNYDESLI